MNTQDNWQWRVVEDVDEPRSTSNPIIDITKKVLKPLEYPARTGARTLARVGEAALGVPGNLANAALSGVNLLQKPFTGGDSAAIGKLQEFNPITSQKIRENITGSLEGTVLPEGYLEPKNDTEKLADDFVSDLTSFLMPIGGAAGFAAKGAKLAKGALKGAAITSGLSNLAGFGTKKATGSETAGNLVKVITSLGTAWVGVPKMAQVAGKGYDTVEHMTPDSLKVSTKTAYNAMNEAEKMIGPYRSTKGGKALMDYFKDTFEPIVSNPEAKLKRIIELDKGFNKVVSQNPSIAYDVKKAHDLIKSAVGKTIQQSGRSDIYDAYKSAKTLYAESFKAQQAQEWAENVAKSTPKMVTRLKDMTKFLLGIPAKTKRGIDEGLRQFAIPEVRRYYFQAISAAANNSRPAWIKAVHMLDKNVDKSKPAENKNWEWRVVD